MKKIAVVYWSGTGNTEAMAMAVAEGVKGSGAEVSVIPAAEFSATQVGEFDALAFGCPSMGVEQLEENEFEPMFTACEGELRGKDLALFGSYGWGDGEWMASWESRCKDDGAALVCNSVICNEAPDDEAIAACRAEVSVIPAAEFSATQVGEFDALAFGCPSMGVEQLEENEFEPMFTACESELRGKDLALFGSYGWGDGEWMASWESRCKDDGAVLICNSVICNEAPDDEAIAACRALGAALV